MISHDPSTRSSFSPRYLLFKEALKSRWITLHKNFKMSKRMSSQNSTSKFRDGVWRHHLFLRMLSLQLEGIVSSWGHTYQPQGAESRLYKQLSIKCHADWQSKRTETDTLCHSVPGYIYMKNRVSIWSKSTHPHTYKHANTCKTNVCMRRLTHKQTCTSIAPHFVFPLCSL